MAPPPPRDGHLPAVPSPLNPVSARPLPRDSRPSAARKTSALLSPTQRLLRKKAQVAWRSEVLRQAVSGGSVPLETGEVLAYPEERAVDDFGLDLESNEKSLLLGDDDSPDSLPRGLEVTQTASAKTRGQPFWRSRRVLVCTALFCILILLPCLRFHPSLRRYF